VRLGIDFGTTRTVVATGDRGNYPLVGFVDAAGDACDWFPSVAAARGGEWRFGFDALAAREQDGWRHLRSFKRALGSAAATGDDPIVTVGDSSLGRLELTTRYLQALAEALRTRSNLPRGVRDERFEAVVAAPANSHATQRFLTMEAFRAAGFEVLAMLNEPSAAGFEYSHRWRATLTRRRDHIVVYDLGGGTFDASLIRAAGRHHEVIATAGLNRLGGDDFDEALARLALAAAGAGDLDALGTDERDRLLARACVAKEGLSPQTRRMVLELDDVVPAGGEVTVPVADFYAECALLVEDTLTAMAPVLGAAAHAEQEAREEGGAPRGSAERGREREPEASESEERDDIAGIYVVGGASALPLVGRALKERFGRRVHRSPYPFAATAIGLAIAADAASGFSLADLLSRNFGVFRDDDAGRSVRFDAIFRRDQAVPAQGAGSVALARRYRAAHNVGHFRFVEVANVDDQGVPAGDITPLGEIRFAFDPALRASDSALAHTPVQRLGHGPMIEERYVIDPSGIVELTIADLDTGYQRAYRLC
jgi:molecular chaperone DnaK (HSP70)